MSASKLTPELQKILDDFARLDAIDARGGKNSLEYRHLHEAIEQTPYLLSKMNNAAKDGSFFQRFRILDENTNAGAEYHGNEQAIYLKLKSLNFPDGKESPKISLIGTLGHELQHGYYDKTSNIAEQRFHHEVDAIARGGLQPKTDGSLSDGAFYGKPLHEFLADRAKDESLAELESWNCAVSYFQAKGVSQQDMFRPLLVGHPHGGQYVELAKNGFAMKEGFSLNPDNTLSPTEKNIAAMQHQYYEKAQTLGHNRNSDYTNYYAASALSYIAQQHEAYGQGKLYVNLKDERISESLVEQNGMTVQVHKGDQSIHRVTYYDPAEPAVARYFDHTEGSIVLRPNTQAVSNAQAHRHVDNGNPDIYTPAHLAKTPIIPQPSHSAPAQGVRPQAEAGEPVLSAAAQARLDSARERVQALYEKNGFDFNKGGEQYVLAVAKLAADKGLARVDLVAVKDGTLHVAQKDEIALYSAQMPTSEVGKVTEQAALQSVVDFVQQQQQKPDAPSQDQSRGGPRM